MNSFDKLQLHLCKTSRHTAGNALRDFLQQAVDEELIPIADCQRILEWWVDCKRDTATYEEIKAYESLEKEIFSRPEVASAVDRWIAKPGQSPPGN
jgi:hypothetical protein